MDGPGPSNEYNGWPDIVDALGLMNLPTIDPLNFTQALSTVVANDVSNLSTINEYGGGVTSQFSLCCALG